LKGRFRAHWLSLALLAPALVLAGLVTGWNLQGWPGRVDDDEGTYVSEAWAMIYEHHFAPYTYWYDHPPLGWAQIAVYGWITDSYHWVASAVMLGRDFMWGYTLIGCVLLYVLCRRLGLRRVAGAAAVVLFAASPLSVYYHRMVSLDNIGTVWLLAALAIAASKRNSLRAAFWSGVATAGGILSKETIAILLPSVVWMVWQHTDRQTRRWNLGIFGVTALLLLLSYPLFAALRGELFPGKGHVSLTWALWWQFFSRAGSGDPAVIGTGSNALLRFWMGMDPWLIGIGTAAALVALFIRRLRPLAIGMAIQVIVPFKGGYLPYFYVTAMLPFAAALIAGTGDSLWDPLAGGARGWAAQWTGPARTLARWAGRAVVVAGVVAFGVGAGPRWWHELDAQSHYNGDGPSITATHWVERYLPRSAVIVTDDYMWPDLKTDGMNPLWMWKVDGYPPESTADLAAGWKTIQYVAVTSETASVVAQSPRLATALAHSVPMASFGQDISVRQVLTVPISSQVRIRALP
jgi:4-amino-4-deoxy-L-arabinose transferase-like glycosyltransferase